MINCIFCGKERAYPYHILEPYECWYIRCDNDECRARGSICDTEAGAIVGWNGLRDQYNIAQKRACDAERQRDRLLEVLKSIHEALDGHVVCAEGTCMDCDFLRSVARTAIAEVESE